MNELRVFENSEFGRVRTIDQNGEPWFVAADVCRALDVGNPSQALTKLDEDEKMTLTSNESHSGQRGGAQSFNVVNEPGLYSLVLGSRKPEAKAFKRWITHEVIPAIRKHGAYATPEMVEKMLGDPDVMIRTLTALKEERRKVEKLEAKVAEDKPKVLFADSVSASKQCILVGELAKLLRQNGVNVGQTRMFERLRNDGYLHKGGNQKNMPTQRSMELGLFEIVERPIINPDGSVRVTRTPKVTGKGQVYFINKYRNAEV